MHSLIVAAAAFYNICVFFVTELTYEWKFLHDRVTTTVIVVEPSCKLLLIYYYNYKIRKDIVHQLV